MEQVENLTDEQKTVIKLKYIEGLTLKEIGDMLELEPKTETDIFPWLYFRGSITCFRCFYRVFHHGDFNSDIHIPGRIACFFNSGSYKFEWRGKPC